LENIIQSYSVTVFKTLFFLKKTATEKHWMMFSDVFSNNSIYILNGIILNGIILNIEVLHTSDSFCAVVLTIAPFIYYICSLIN